MLSDCGLSRDGFYRWNSSRSNTRDSGVDVPQLIVNMITSVLEPDLASKPTCQVGHTLLLDSRVPDCRSAPKRSVAGFKDCVLITDKASGYVVSLGRKKKDQPELILDKATDIWNTEHHSLKMVKTNDEFIINADVELFDGSRVDIKQAPLFDHRRPWS